jgi:ABC-2 type transport system permease protein
MKRILKVYPTLLRAYWHRALMYRIVFLISLLNAAFPLVMMFIWIGMSQGGEIGGYQSADFVTYYLLAILVRRITAVGIVQDLENLVRTGDLSAHLLKPMNVMHHFVARNLAMRTLNIPVIAVPVIAALLLMPGVRLNLSLLNLLLFMAACVVGLAFDFLTQYAIGGLSFWVTQAHGINAGFYLAKSFLGGYIVPIALFPAAAQSLLRLLPFQSGVALPVDILTGRIPAAQALIGLVICSVWVVVIALGNQMLWQAGLRSYSAVGA